LRLREEVEVIWQGVGLSSFDFTVLAASMTRLEEEGKAYLLVG
jgi:hypothetical protein